MATASRPYDSLYDTTYAVSGIRDHYREQSRNIGLSFSLCPNYSNFFSQLQHHPSHGFRFKPNDKVPAFVDRTMPNNNESQVSVAMRSSSHQIAGPQQWQYIKRPLLGTRFITATSAQVLHISQLQHQQHAAAPFQRHAAIASPDVAGPTKTTGTQSDYRESEAQTTPWEPDFVLPELPSAKQQYLSDRYCTLGPELLELRSFKFGAGLPPGLVEVERIDRLREKRTFEASLPPLDDPRGLELRQKMIEEWERKEWEDRDAEVEGIQAKRLELLEQALKVREEDKGERILQRVEALKSGLADKAAAKLAYLGTERVKALRHFTTARRTAQLSPAQLKPDLLDLYANYGSPLYAPVTREGRFPNSWPKGQEIETEGYQPTNLPAINQLEAFLPRKLLQVRYAAPQQGSHLSYRQRQELSLQRELKNINDTLDKSKTGKGRGFGECWPCPLDVATDGKRATTAGRHNDERPPTPVAPQVTVDLVKQRAAILLQQLIRGRAVQNAMFAGHMQCIELIHELQLSERDDLGVPAILYATPSKAEASADALIGKIISQLAAEYCQPPPSKE